MDAGVRLAGGILLLAPVHAGLVGALVARLPLPRAFGRAAEHERAVAASGPGRGPPELDEN